MSKRASQFGSAKKDATRRRLDGDVKELSAALAGASGQGRDYSDVPTRNEPPNQPNLTATIIHPPPSTATIISPPPCKETLERLRLLEKKHEHDLYRCKRGLVLEAGKPHPSDPLAVGVQMRGESGEVFHVTLTNSWAEEYFSHRWIMEPGDVVHLLGEPTMFKELAETQHCLLSDSPEHQHRLLVLHPDILLTGTTVADALKCRRFALLKYDIADTGSKSSEPLIVGNVVHSVIQTALASQDFSEAYVESLLQEEMRKQLVDLWIGNIEFRDILGNARSRLRVAKEWATRYYKPLLSKDSGAIVDVKRPLIQRLVGNEQNVCSHKFGFKGKLDGLVRLEDEEKVAEMARVGSTMGGENTKTAVTTVADPALEALTQKIGALEIKTGKVKTEHVGQVTVYYMLLCDLVSQKALPDDQRVHQSGLLLYPHKDKAIYDAKAISRHDIHGIMHIRNVLAATVQRRRQTLDEGVLRGPIFPPMIPREDDGKEPSECRWCFRKKHCYTLGAAIEFKTHLAPELDAPTALYIQKWQMVMDAEESLNRKAIEGVWRSDMTLTRVDNNAGEGFTGKSSRARDGNPSKGLRYLKFVGTTSNMVLAGLGKELENTAHTKRDGKPFYWVFEVPEDEAKAKLSCLQAGAGSKARFTQLDDNDDEPGTSSRDVFDSLPFTIGDSVSLSREPMGPFALFQGKCAGFASESRRVFVTPRIEIHASLATALGSQMCATQLHDMETLGSDGLGVNGAPGTNDVYRLDKDEYGGGFGNLRGDLMALVTTSEEQNKFVSKLKRKLIHLEPPSFSNHDKDVAFGRQAAKIPPGMIAKHAGCADRWERLNDSQKQVIEKCFLADDYCVVQGFPGTGKTEVLAVLLELLVRSGKRVLFCAYTNAAVDNGLMRLLSKKSEDPIEPVRMGNEDKIHPDLRKYAMKLRKFADVDEVRLFAEEKTKLVACTLLGCHDALVQALDFDVVVVDEASQATEPATWAALFKTRKFVLFGDTNQLQPLVRHPKAAANGMQVSLMERLALRWPECVATLSVQYRMNEQIQCLPNKLIYDGKLTCGNAEVSKRKIQLQMTEDESLPAWLQAVLDPEKGVVVLDTGDLCPENPQTHQDNKLEADICMTIVLIAMLSWEFLYFLEEIHNY